MKKAIVFVTLLFIILLLTGYQPNKSIGVRNIEGLLLELYQVENTKDYQELREKQNQYLQEVSELMPTETGILTMAPEGVAELFKPYIAKYKRYCSEAALQGLLKNRYISKFDQLAWEEECRFYVKDIQIKKDQDRQYYYTVEVEKRAKDGTSQAKKGEGIVQLNEEGYVDLFNVTKRVDF
ncbi:hypothetical protein SAMN02745215_04391 [Desulfitobacterium chlororespirans DSM 11544]|uniref:Uncharacterized protein n=2 Tax=Desulfitobacterium chlororespirans TaxID=51616 RepID=A0A1M7UQS9_9FIRM|nr:hypothetical protein SAMN02745215_04391 [Desulfitobacterium chlororespirans DSM 11544]